MKGPEEKTRTAFRGSKAGVREEMRRYIQKLTDLPRKMEHEIEEELHGAKEGASKSKDKARVGIRRAKDVLLQPYDADTTHHRDDNENEADWHDVDEKDYDNLDAAEPGGAEDMEGSSGQPSSSSAAATGKSSTAPSAAITTKKRSISPRHRSTNHPIFSQSRVSAGKRRESFRRGVLGARQRMHPPSPAQLAARSPSPGNAASPAESEVETEAEDSQLERQRGRSTDFRNMLRLSTSSISSSAARLPGSSGVHTPRGSISHLRYDSIRTASPSRSIRFADDQQAGSVLGSQTPVVSPRTPPPGDTTPGGGSAAD